MKRLRNCAILGIQASQCPPTNVAFPQQRVDSASQPVDVDAHPSAIIHPIVHPSQPNSPLPQMAPIIQHFAGAAPPLQQSLPLSTTTTIDLSWSCSLTSVIATPLWLTIFASLLTSYNIARSQKTQQQQNHIPPAPPTSQTLTSSPTPNRTTTAVVVVTTLALLLAVLSFIAPFILATTSTSSSIEHLHARAQSQSQSQSHFSQSQKLSQSKPQPRFQQSQSRSRLHTLVVPALIRQPGEVPVIDPFPSPSPTPSPTSLSPAPSPPSNPAPPVQSTTTPQPSFTQQTNTNGGGSNSNAFRPARDRCAAGLRRMLVVLLLELCFEFLFLFVRCFADQTVLSPPGRGEARAVDITYRGYVFVRGMYAIVVLIINCCVYWIGGGPNGACLTSYGEVQIAFAHLIFYLLYCVFAVVIGIYRIDMFDEKENAGSYSYSPSGGRTNDGRSAASPPDRTESYFHSSRRRRPATDSSYEQPKFRFNFGCCAINF